MATFTRHFPVPSLSPLGFDSITGFGTLKAQLANLLPSISSTDLDDQTPNPNSRQLVVEKDGGPAWIHMMDRSTPTMAYKAWRRDPQTGPPQYCSSTIIEDATPEMVREFFGTTNFGSSGMICLYSIPH